MQQYGDHPRRSKGKGQCLSLHPSNSQPPSLPAPPAFQLLVAKWETQDSGSYPPHPHPTPYCTLYRVKLPARATKSAPSPATLSLPPHNQKERNPEAKKKKFLQALPNHPAFLCLLVSLFHVGPTQAHLSAEETRENGPSRFQLSRSDSRQEPTPGTTPARGTPTVVGTSLPRATGHTVWGSKAVTRMRLEAHGNTHYRERLVPEPKRGAHLIHFFKRLDWKRATV